MEVHQYFAKVLSLFNDGLDYDTFLDKSGIAPSLTKTYHVCNSCELMFILVLSI